MRMVSGTGPGDTPYSYIYRFYTLVVCAVRFMSHGVMYV